jgi:aryl-alcohol dehydrogenase-like predicted oxidoreductase
MAFKPLEKPPSRLGYYRVLSPSAGVRVSPLCLGAMNFGDAWKEFMGECTKETAFDILDTYFNAGGNFIDTANNYQAEQSETWLGEWMNLRRNRNQIVLATKFTIGFPSPHENIAIKANYAGNHNKSLKISVEASLRKLRVDYIDILYVHVSMRVPSRL